MKILTMIKAAGLVLVAALSLVLGAPAAMAAPGYAVTTAGAFTLGTATATGRVLLADAKTVPSQPRSWTFSGSTTAGAGSATVTVEASDDGVTWISPAVCTATLTLSTTKVSGGCRDESSFRYYSMNVTAISGTGASVTVTAAY